MSRLTDLHNNPQVLERWRYRTEFCGLCFNKCDECDGKLPPPPAGCKCCIRKISEKLKYCRKRKNERPAVRVQRFDINSVETEENDGSSANGKCSSCVLGQTACRISGKDKCKCQCHA